MSFFKLVLKSLWYYRRLNLTVVFGVALSTAILLGALIIGDSVKYSLEQITQNRLGKTTLAITSGERLFRKQLAEDLSSGIGIRTTALLRSNGIGVLDGGKFQLNQIAVWGVDSSLNYFASQSKAFNLTGNQVAINENLAEITGLKVGDEFLIRINKLTTFPANTPFVSATETTISFRIVVIRILHTEELGNFSLQNIQSSPRNLFLNLDWMNEQMQLQQKANVILAEDGIARQDLIQKLQQSWKLEDMNLSIRENLTLKYTELKSDRVFIEPAIEQFCTDSIRESYPVFSYFINDFSLNGRKTPYSFVSTSDTLSDRQIIVSDWLAADLKLKKKDTLHIGYYEVGPLRQLVQKDTTFQVERIFKMEGALADPNLMPDIPSLSDVGNCRDWKTGVPVDLKKIRPQDENYWKEHKGTPKAFVSLKTAKKLWGNRFGQSTAIHFENTNKKSLEQLILTKILPSQVGFEVRNVKSEGLTAAASGVDFGQLFIGLSFFVLVAAFLLAYLLFTLFLEYRTSEIGVLRATGFSFHRIRKLFFTEASLLIISGIIIGTPFAFLYDLLILKAINTIWFDIVRTTIAKIYVQQFTLISGFFAIAAISVLLFYLVLNRFLKKQLLSAQKKANRTIVSKRKRSLIIGAALIILSMLILISSGLEEGAVNTELFYLSGFGLLPGLLFLLDSILRSIAQKESASAFSLRSFILKRLSGERKRTLLSVSFLSIGIFLVVSTGLFRKEISLTTDNTSSETGGYTYFIETTLPVLFDPSTAQAKDDLGLPSNSLIAAFHVQPGDDASCLNLNRVSRPRIIACNPAILNERKAFTFIAHTKELDEKNLWNSLNTKLPDQVIPAFADMTVIQWGLGKNIGDTLIYKNEQGETLKLKLIGGLENSVFQGNVLIAEEFFVKAFPSVSGANLFLVQAAINKDNTQNFREGWRHYGAEITNTADRLRSFNQIENTYLNIFLLLGALGLLIGTFGLGILIFRTILEQISEFGLLQSIGFQRSKILRILFIEKMLLIITAVVVAVIPAIISALPLLSSAAHSNLWIWLPSVSMLVIGSGLLFCLLAIRIAFRINPIASLRGE